MRMPLSMKISIATQALIGLAALVMLLLLHFWL